VPSKTSSILSAERPILASFDYESELSKIIRDNSLGLVADANNEIELKNSIRILLTNKEERGQLLENIRLYNRGQRNNAERCVNRYVESLIV